MSTENTAKDALLSRVHSLIQVLNQYGDSELDVEYLDNLITRSYMLYNHAVRLALVDMIEESTITKLRNIVDLLEEKEEEARAACMSFQSAREHSGLRGRPKFRITESQLSYLIDNGFKGVDMATMLGVSEATIHRRLKDFNINTSRSFTQIDDTALDETIQTIKVQAPNAGYRMVLGHLRARGITVQQLRVRESMRRVDTEGTISRWLSVTERRKYSVSSPNALWHIDGNHKLIRGVSMYNFILK